MQIAFYVSDVFLNVVARFAPVAERGWLDLPRMGQVEPLFFYFFKSLIKPELKNMHKLFLVERKNFSRSTQ